VVSVEVAEVAGLAVEVQHVCEVDGVPYDSCRVHEVVGDLLAHQKNNLHPHILTINGPK
jgi:hypothetical protein